VGGWVCVVVVEGAWEMTKYGDEWCEMRNELNWGERNVSFAASCSS